MFCEILINTVIGLLTGATSGLIVTVWFRHIDKEREKNKYFFMVYKYIHNMVKPLSNIEDESNLKELYIMITNQICRERYLCFNKKEKEIINKFDQIFISVLKPTIDLYIWSENKKNKLYYTQRKEYVDNIVSSNLDILKNIDIEQLKKIAQNIIDRK